MADEVRPYEEQIGRAIMTVQKAVKTVCVDEGVKEEYRTRQLRIVAGEDSTETVHKEYGMVFKIDVRKVFFSPRLATERDLVARQVRPGEIVIDMFAGIGPFSLMIAKTREPKVVYAIDTNPEAIRYMEENIALNKVGSVTPILGDAKDEVAKLEKADRIIMNLPHNARDFLPFAIDALKPGGVIHFYEIMEDSDLESRFGSLADIAVRKGRVMKELARRKVKSYSPTSGFYAFDLSFL
jgi:tRNA (guanine37-N1)-methyltransferase